MMLRLFSSGASCRGSGLAKKKCALVPNRREYSSFNLSNSVLDFPEQKVFAGTECLGPFLKQVKQNSPSARRPLVVSDKGVAKIGIVDSIVNSLKENGFQPSVFDNSQPNPSVEDCKGIARAFLQSNCDICIGVGGGGPLDAMKAGMAVVAKQKLEPQFSIDKQGTDFVTGLRALCQKMPNEFISAIPAMCSIPTTAGTGSEGGKSSVITDPNGVKFVFGHPAFFSKLVALVPQYTEKLPPDLTAATGIDALFHATEAWFVSEPAAIADGLDKNGIERCEKFAIEGIELVVKNLPKVFKNGSDLQSRLNMQIAALYGAKAFRKGDLGGVHATAHSVGALYHIHHGTSIARMAVPVLRFNEAKAVTVLWKSKFDTILKIFNDSGVDGDKLSVAVHNFLKQFGVQFGLNGLNVTEKEIDVLTKMAKKDPCQTNPFSLEEGDYRNIFLDAWKM